MLTASAWMSVVDIASSLCMSTIQSCSSIEAETLSRLCKFLTGRKYLVVRAIGDAPNESGADAQKRTIGAFYGAVEEWDPK